MDNTLVVLIFVVTALLCAFSLLAVEACLYYVSPYARATKRDFFKMLRDPRARLQNKLGGVVAKSYERGEAYALFDVRIPREGKGDSETASLVDAVVVTPQGCYVIAVVAGSGEVVGAKDDGSWVTYAGGRGIANGEAAAIPNAWTKACSDAEAASSFLDVARDLPRIPLVVVGNRMRVSVGDADAGYDESEGGIRAGQNGDGEMRIVHVGDLGELLKSEASAGAIADNEAVQAASTSPGDELLPNAAKGGESEAGGEGSPCAKAYVGAKQDAVTARNGEARQDGNEGHSDAAGRDVAPRQPEASGQVDASDQLDAAERLRVARLLKANVQTAPVDLDGDKISVMAARAGEKAYGLVHDKRDEAADADIVRRADRIASMKQDLDGVSWDRVIELSDRMMRAADYETRADLNAEIRLIARANLSLAYRLGIPLGQTRVEANEEAGAEAGASGGTAGALVSDNATDALALDNPQEAQREVQPIEHIPTAEGSPFLENLPRQFSFGPSGAPSPPMGPGEPTSNEDESSGQSNDAKPGNEEADDDKTE